MKIYTNRLLICALLTLLPAIGNAADPILLDEIMVRGSSVPSNEEILTIREVRESPARDIGEAVQNMPGVTILRKGPIANDIVLRGLQRDNINVLMDGVRVQGGCPSRMDPPAFHFDFAEIEAIEIVKGPYDLRYAGSLGGLVNITGKEIQPGSGVAATATYGSYDLVNASITASHGGEKSEALIGYAYKYSRPPESGDGKRITDIYPSSSKNRYRADDLDSRAYDINTFWFKGKQAFAPGVSSELDLAYQDADHVLYPGLLMDAEYDRTKRINWTTTFEKPIEQVKEVKLQVYWTDVDHLMHDQFRESSQPNMMITRDYMMQTDADTTVTGINLTGVSEVGSGEILGGIDYFYRNWNAVNESAMYMAYQDQPMIPDVDNDQFGLFAEYSRPLSATLTIKGGARLDYAKSDATKLSSERLAGFYLPYYPGQSLDDDNDFFAPSVNLQMFWKPAEGIELFAGLASASRMPDPEELYIGLQRIPNMNAPNPTSWVGNPSLNPVRNNQADLGLKYSSDRYVVNGSVFYSDLSDYITLVPISDPDGPGIGTLAKARGYANVDARIWGGEISSQVSLPFDLYMLGSLAYTEGKNRDNGEPLAEIPPLSGSIGLRYDIDSFFVEVTERFAARQDRVDTQLNEDETSGWGVTDIKSGLNLDKWAVYAGINNLFDKYYYTHLSYQRDPFQSGVKVPEVGAFAYVTAAYRF